MCACVSVCVPVWEPLLVSWSAAIIIKLRTVYQQKLSRFNTLLLDTVIPRMAELVIGDIP